ncbi:MAG: hypothetical protein DLM60_17275 [Pseudonocardiales bacterium]|nr:MAG: hypothetical protein DLM60_17275 [Pseudonocardiales bacterium]
MPPTTEAIIAPAFAAAVPTQSTSQTRCWAAACSTLSQPQHRHPAQHTTPDPVHRTSLTPPQRYDKLLGLFST